eukprot:111128_1
MAGRKRTYEEACEDSKPPQPQPVAPQSTQEQVFSKQLLQIYYDRLFPYQDMFNWLSYFNDPEHKNPAIDRKIWRNREFSFTLKDDIYVRYKSYKTMKEFKDDLRRKCPYKIDIGALYNIEPCRRRTIASDKFIPEQKEFVMDIDISDYDDVRTCCSEAAICTQCWPLMCCAIRVLDRALRDDFGLKHLLWVFSGRRGIHCWVGDDIVRHFDVHQRSAMIDYLKLYSGNSMNKYKVDMQIDKTRDIHTSLARAFEICVQYFVSCSLEKQHVLDTEEGINYFCDMIRFPEVQRDVRNALLQEMDSMEYADKWNKGVFEVFEKHMKKKGANKRALTANRMELVFSYVYPRLDVEVSRHVNHLLKSPFCIHPKTGKLCSIIDPAQCETFDPVTQPTLLQLVNEYNKAGKENGNKNIGWRDTSLKGIIQVFRETFLNDLQREKLKILKMQHNSVEF